MYIKVTIIAVSLLLSSCANIATSAAESALVYIIAKHDEVVEKKQKRYTATDKCVVKNMPDAVATGDAIAYGKPITEKYDRILSRTGEDIPPVEPLQLAYAFYIIGDNIHDTRAKAKLAWIENYMDPKEANEIKDIIGDKYLSSHLEKCFSVPDMYRIKKTTRDFIKEEQLRMERKK